MQGEAPWQSECGRCSVVLHEVFSWLSGAELAHAGATCRAWRRAAAAPALWRRLLHRECGASATPAAGALAWRQEYVCARAGWAPAKCHSHACCGATLLHAALAPAHDALALGTDDASLAVWRREHATWRPLLRMELRTRGWACVRAVSWARAAPRLLLAGERQLAHDWELLVLELDEDYGGAHVTARALGSPGAAGCWLGAAAFLSLELRLVAPGLACTTVWLNAATQETQSEYAGVTTPLLRIFNEDGAHITHALVAEADGAEDDDALLVAGSARGLRAWRVARCGPPAMLAGASGELAARARAYRARPARVSPPPPDEAAVRAACAPPERECRLPAPLVGLALHDSGGWLCATCGDGSVRRVCARLLREEGAWWPAPPSTPSPLAAVHYVQPAATGRYVASPAGAYSACVHTWALSTGARAGSVRAGERSREGAGERAACVCALLPRGGARAQLLALAGDTLHVWRSRATRQAGP